MKLTKPLIIAIGAGITLLIGGVVAFVFLSPAKTATPKDQPKIESKGSNQSVIKTSDREGNKNEEYPEDQQSSTLKSMKLLTYTGSFEKIVEEMEAITKKHSLTEGKINLELASIYKDAQAMKTIYDSASIEEGEQRMSQFESPVVMAFAPLHVFGVLTNGLALDNLSLDPSGENQITDVTETFWEKGDSHIDSTTEVANYVSNKQPNLEGVYRYDFSSAGTPLYCYVAHYTDQTNKLIGYYTDVLDLNYKFQTIKFYQEQQYALDKAISSNWGQN